MLDLPTPSLAVFIALILLPILYLIPRLTSLLSPTSATTTHHHHPPTEVVSLRIYPIKSCRGIELQRSKLLKTGLELDRRWMIVDASTHEFLTIRQIPSMTLINTALSDDSNDLIISISGTNKEVAIPLRPSPDWLDQHTTLRQVKVWDVLTDGYVYGDAVNSLLSEFLGRDVCLVYKGPTPRGLKGNGAPEVLGREQFTNFPDLHPVQIASLASIEELNSRLVQRGDKPISVERFRPNIIVKGNAPWIEDSWKTVRISSSRDDTTGYIDFDVLARCARCQVPNVNPDSAEKHPREPWDTLVGYRRVDEGIKFKPCFGMLSAPRSEGVLETGMRFEVTKTGEHHYIKGF